MPVDANQLDVEKLAAYLSDRIEGFEGPLVAEKFAGGQSNPTFLLKARSGHYVLRRQPPGQLLKSAHAVDREFRVLSALAATDVPVARAYHLCEDRSVIGSMFYVMSFEAGRIFWDPTMPEIAVGERAAYYEAILRSMAAMHDVDIEAVGLGDFGRPGGNVPGPWPRVNDVSAKAALPGAMAAVRLGRAERPIGPRLRRWRGAPRPA